MWYYHLVIYFATLPSFRVSRCWSLSLWAASSRRAPSTKGIKSLRQKKHQAAISWINRWKEVSGELLSRPIIAHRPLRKSPRQEHRLSCSADCTKSTDDRGGRKCMLPGTLADSRSGLVSCRRDCPGSGASVLQHLPPSGAPNIATTTAPVRSAPIRSHRHRISFTARDPSKPKRWW